MEKISETQIKQKVSQPDIIIIHDIDDLTKKRDDALEQIENLHAYIEDLNKLIKEAEKLGCKLSAKEPKEE